MGPKEDCCTCPIPFSWFWTWLSTMRLLKLPDLSWITWNHREWQVPLDLACLKYVPLKPFWCIFPSQNQENVKCWLFPELPLSKNWKNPSICMVKKCLQRLFKSAHDGFLGTANRNCTMLELRNLTSTFWVIMACLLHFYGNMFHS